MPRSSAVNTNLVKFFGIALFFAPAWGLLWHRVNFNPDEWAASWAFGIIRHHIDDGHPYQAAIYLSIYLIGLAGILIIPFLRGSIVRSTAVVILMAGWFVEHFFLEMNGLFTDRSLISLLWDEWHLAGDAVSAYRVPLLHNLLLALGLLAIFLLPPRRPLVLSSYWAAVPTFAVLLTGALVNYSKTMQVFPVPYAITANAAALGLGIGSNLPFGYFTAKNIVLNRPIDAPFEPAHRFKKIIMVMDESVHGGFLSINNPALDTTPFLKNETRLINFGIAISGGNCSSISRTIFRYGIRAHDLPNAWDHGTKNPLIWQYASRAGYRTIHIDGLAGPFKFHNGFTSKETSLIDTQIGVLDDPAYARDGIIAERALSLLKEDGPMFLLIDKHGLHFPYELRHPPSDRAKTTIEHYMLGITWSIDEFFRRLMPKLDLSDALLIYTSDHGQQFNGGQPHCSVNQKGWGIMREISRDEATVPLFAATGNPVFELHLRQSAKAGFNTMSHFELFPTLLIAMGYDERWVRDRYGPSMLDGPLGRTRSFLVGQPYINPAMISADSEHARGEN